MRIKNLKDLILAVHSSKLISSMKKDLVLKLHINTPHILSDPIGDYTYVGKIKYLGNN